MSQRDSHEHTGNNSIARNTNNSKTFSRVARWVRLNRLAKFPAPVADELQTARCPSVDRQCYLAGEAKKVAIAVHGVSISRRSSDRFRHPPRSAAHLTSSSSIFAHSSAPMSKASVRAKLEFPGTTGEYLGSHFQTETLALSRDRNLP
jgi:hypothetical protein